MIDGATGSELVTGADLAELKAELYRAILLQTEVTIGVIVTLLKLLP